MAHCHGAVTNYNYYIIIIITRVRDTKRGREMIEIADIYHQVVFKRQYVRIALAKSSAVRFGG